MSLHYIWIKYALHYIERDESGTRHIFVLTDDDLHATFKPTSRKFKEGLDIDMKYVCHYSLQEAQR